MVAARRDGSWVHYTLTDAAERKVLGPNVAINLVTVDETNTHILPHRIASDLKRRGARLVVQLVGVQPEPATAAHRAAVRERNRGSVTLSERRAASRDGSAAIMVEISGADH